MLLAPCDRSERLSRCSTTRELPASPARFWATISTTPSATATTIPATPAGIPDGNWGQLFACKIAFYLDPVTRDSGCLRVIPGSHKPEHFVRANTIHPAHAMEDFGVAPRDFPGNMPLESNPGDLVIFNHDLYHAAFGGSAAGACSR